MSQFRPPSQPGQWNQPESNQSYPQQETSYQEWYQSQYPPRPETYYRSQQPQPAFQPPVQPPRKELSRANLYIIVSIVIVIVIFGSGLFWRSFTGTDGTQSTQPSQSGTWTTTHTFSRNGIKETGIFTVSNDWQLQWTCDPASSSLDESYIGVYVYNADGTLAGLAINTICKAGNTSDSTELHQSGSIYLEINSTAAWTLTIQELE
jgi:hypothetical protein